MQVDLPASVKGQHAEAKNGMKFFVLPQISIPQGRSMTLTVRGLPSAPEWKAWAPRIVGLIAVVIMIGGVVIGIRYRPNLARKPSKFQPASDGGALERKQRREKLMDELVALDANGSTTTSARREEVLAALEELWEP
jgi:hypothetical protein